MGKSEEIRRAGSTGTTVSWVKEGVIIDQPDPGRMFTPFEAIAFAGAILAAAAEMMEDGAPDYLDA